MEYIKYRIGLFTTAVFVIIHVYDYLIGLGPESR